MSLVDKIQMYGTILFIVLLFVVPSSILLWRSALNKWGPKRRKKSKTDKDEQN